MEQLAKQYDPHAFEAKIYQAWDDAGIFSPDTAAMAGGIQPFVISLPPPNITGRLHMGHALQDTIMDILARQHRLLGDPVAWLPGTDSAALPTNKIINDQLTAEGTTRQAIGREAFEARARQWYATTSAEILDQMKRLGCSCDWSRARFTMDEAYLAAVNEAFMRFSKAGYIYRGKRLVNWDPAAQTTVSDLEIEWQEQRTPLYTLQYGPFQISTARPETKFGDQYVVMHPADKRYLKYKHGDTLEVAWITGAITATIIKDEAVDINFGTGVMTITPWHDAIDFAIAERHSLKLQQIIDFDGRLLPIAADFSGMNITQARPKIVAKLQDLGLVVSVDEKYKHNVALNERGHGVIEPQVMRQWFMRMDKIKQAAIQAAQTDAVRFFPPRWKEHFVTWLEDVYDWNINRQIWLGHRLPVWWKKGTHGSDHEEGNYVVSLDKPEGVGWEQDPDVLDTWFATALWPFAQLGWPEATPDLQQLYPTSVLVTARDILYLWVVRMVFVGLELMPGAGELSEAVPFREVFIHPTVLTKDGKRMSKSLGTGIDPLELITKYGADATRFGLMYMMSYDNQALRFDETTIITARNFANKLWNIARFLQQLPAREEHTIADEWILGKVVTVRLEVAQLLAGYKIGEATRVLYDFVWSDFADWYIEIIKTQGSTQVAQQAFKDILMILHPFMPFITEVLWQECHYGEKQLAASVWPATKLAELASPVQRALEEWRDVVRLIRSVRALLEIPVQAQVKVAVDNTDLLPALQAMTKSELVVAGDMKMKRFPLPSGKSLAIGSPHITATSIAAATARLTKQQEQLSAHVARTQAILAQMHGKATAEAIAKQEANVQQANTTLTELAISLAALDG